MIRVAFTLIGGRNWTGGYNYLLNLVRALSKHAAPDITPVLFFGSDVPDADVLPFRDMPGVVVVRDSVFDEEQRSARLRQALLTGCDRAAADAFATHRIDMVFEPAQFYGWRFSFPGVAWIPDFQHRYMRHLFSFGAYWKREIGFRAQVLSGRHVMLSSEDARSDCERFYPATRGRTHVVRFSIPPADNCDAAWGRSVADGYGLPEHFFFLPNQFWAHKNHECVIRALHVLKEQGKELVVAVSGKQADPRNPEHFPGLSALIDALGVRENFRLLGLIPIEHIPALMRSCSALINPSFFEGWSTTVEEAKSMGTPMLLSDLRVHREQSRDALFFDATKPQALAELMANFVPLPEVDRMVMAESAAEQASERTRLFAEEFCGLAIQVVENK